MCSENQQNEQVYQTGKLHNEGSFGYKGKFCAPPSRHSSYLKSFLPGKAGPGTTRLGKRLGCPSGICLGNPWMLTFTSNFESVTSSTVAI